MNKIHRPLNTLCVKNEPIETHSSHWPRDLRSTIEARSWKFPRGSRALNTIQKSRKTGDRKAMKSLFFTVRATNEHDERTGFSLEPRDDQSTRSLRDDRTSWPGSGRSWLTTSSRPCASCSSVYQRLSRRIESLLDRSAAISNSRPWSIVRPREEMMARSTKEIEERGSS